MKLSSALVPFLLGVVVMAILARALPSPAPSTSAPAETAYDRVVRTETLRCAYALYPPFLQKDPNTQKLSGAAYDFVTRFGTVSGLKIVWGPEIDWGDIAATLNAGKADAFCTTMLLTPQRGRQIAGTQPVLYGTVEAFARPDDKRFDNAPDRINQPDVKIAVNMGDLSEEIAKRLFPKAQRVYKGAVPGDAELFLNVMQRKADLTISGPSNLSAFLRDNPDKALRRIAFRHPLMTFPSVIGVAIGEQKLLHLLNATLTSLINSGEIEQILRASTGADYGLAYFPPRRALD